MNRTHERSNQDQIHWRREKVLDLSSDGYSERQIAERLRISQPTINRDLAYLREKAKENIRHYIDEKLPLEYQKCLIGLNGILSKMSDIMNNANANERDVMQATTLKMQAYSMKIDLLSNANVVHRAVQFVENHKPRSPGSTYQNSQ